MGNIDSINKRLENLYGRELDGRPRFRVVWSTTQLEFRVGEFAVYSGSIYLRTEKGAREVPKYGYAPDRWVLEKAWHHVNNPELLRSESYEPIWIFQDTDGNALEPVWRAVEMVVHAFLNPAAPKSEATLVQEDKDERAREAEINYQIISNESPYLATMMHNKEAAFFDSTKIKDKK